MTWLLIGLFFSTASWAQRVEWAKGYESGSTIKLDNADNLYLVNSFSASRNNWLVSKSDANGNPIWRASLTLNEGYVTDGSLNFTLDPAGNLYGVISFNSLAGVTITAKNGSFLVGKSSGEANETIREERMITFKINQAGEYQWASVFKSYDYNLYYSKLVYDTFSNTLYHNGSYVLNLKSTQTTLHTIATQYQDTSPIVFLSALDGGTGQEKALKNLHRGLAGTLIPLADRLAYCSPAFHNSFWWHLSREGELLQAKPLASYVDANELTGADVNGPFFYQAGRSMTVDPVYGGYDHHNKIRKLDLYGDVIAEKSFAFWIDLYQYTNVVFSSFEIKSIDENNVMALVNGVPATIDFGSTEFQGEPLSEKDYRFILFDKELNIRKKYSFQASNYLFTQSLEYSKKDNAFYILFNTDNKTQITLGGRTWEIGGGNKPNTLIKLRFEDLELLSDQNEVLSLLLNQQTKTAQIDRINRVVTAFVGPGTDRTKLEAKLFLSENAKLKSPLNLPVDLSTPKKVTVVSKTGRETQWTIQVHKTFSAGNQIELVEVPGQIQVRKDTVNREIEVMVERDVNLKNLRFAKFAVSAFASVSPDPFSLGDLSGTQNFSITAENGDKAEWKILVKRKLSQEKRIVDFALKDQRQASKINDIDQIIEVDLAAYADWENTIERITLSPGAEIIPASSEKFDFSKEVLLTVKAEDGSTETWTVRARKADIITLNQAVKVYPVPADDVITIDLQFLERAPAEIELRTLEGRKLLQQQAAPAPTAEILLNLKPFSPGIYFLRLLHANQVYVQKILIQH
ncbi:MAG: T9SS type A sorting domain-containing protein [Adhaeribacter sp.]